jgi:hypothetical protein
MSTVRELSVKDAEFPFTANAAFLVDAQYRPYIAFDAATDENCYWTFPMPQGVSGTLTLYLQYRMASATSGNVIMAAAVEAVTDGDATDLDAGSSFDTVNTSSAEAVPGTAGYKGEMSITLTNADSYAAGDYVRIKLSRDADNGSDTATGDLHLLIAELRDAA